LVNEVNSNQKSNDQNKSITPYIWKARETTLISPKFDKNPNSKRPKTKNTDKTNPYHKRRAFSPPNKRVKSKQNSRFSHRENEYKRTFSEDSNVFSNNDGYSPKKIPIKDWNIEDSRQTIPISNWKTFDINKEFKFGEGEQVSFRKVSPKIKNLSSKTNRIVFSQNNSRNIRHSGKSNSFHMTSENNMRANQVINYNTGTADIPYISPELILNNFKSKDDLEFDIKKPEISLDLKEGKEDSIKDDKIFEGNNKIVHENKKQRVQSPVPRLKIKHQTVKNVLMNEKDLGLSFGNFLG